MARKKRPSKVRPKSPARVRKKTRRRSRSHHHPELIGLGLAAFGLFIGSVLYAGWNGGYVGKAIGDGAPEGSISRRAGEEHHARRSSSYDGHAERKMRE